MQLPKAEDLRACLQAIRDAKLQEAGVTHVRLGALEVRIAPAPVANVTGPAQSVGADLVAKINGESPLPAVEVMSRGRTDVPITGAEDALEALASHRVPGAGPSRTAAETFPPDPQ